MPRFKKAKKNTLTIIGFATSAIVWQIASIKINNPAMPRLEGIFKTLLELIMLPQYISNVISSLITICIGISLAVVLGFTLGILVYRYESIKLAIMPVIECIRGVAALTLFPLLIVLIGIGLPARVFVIFWTTWPAVLLSTIESLDIDSDIADAASICSTSQWNTIIHIRLPIGACGIMTGIRIGASGGWIGLIAAEMLGATKGLGYYLLWCSQSFKFEEVYATIIVIALIGGAMNAILKTLQNTMRI
jgi:ABC-type nitrate/sulfonate/bicarbonate transport system permease component